MHIGLITLELTGHLNPFTTLGSELVRRGHKVSLIAGRPAEKLARDRGLNFIPLGIEGDLDKSVQAKVKRLGELSGTKAMWHGSNIVAAMSEMVERDLPAVLENEHFDGLIIDQFSVAGYHVAHQNKLPIVIACAAMMVAFDAWEPLPSTNFPYRTDAYGIARNKVIRAGLLSVHAMRLWWKKQGLDPLALILDQQAGLARIAQQPEFLNLPRHQPLSDHLHFTGPWHQPHRDDGMEFPWERLGNEPIIYASMGTLQNGVSSVFKKIIEALGKLPHQAVLSMGGSHIDMPSKIPDNVIVVKYAPQLRLLERSRLVVTHAGLNTALECLSRGVPMMCLPVTNDQPGVAKRIEFLGAGRSLPVGKVTSSRLLSELQKMLATTQYEEKAKWAAAQLRHNDGLLDAAAIVEKAFTTRERITKNSLAPIVTIPHPFTASEVSQGTSDVRQSA